MNGTPGSGKSVINNFSKLIRPNIFENIRQIGDCGFKLYGIISI